MTSRKRSAIAHIDSDFGWRMLAAASLAIPGTVQASSICRFDSRASFDFDFKHDSLLPKRSQRPFFRLASRALLLQSEVRLRQPDHFT